MNATTPTSGPFKELKLIIFLPSLIPLGMRSAYDEARLKLLFRRIHAEIDEVHPDYLTQTGIFQILTSTDSATEETAELLLDSTSALRRFRDERRKDLQSKNSMLDTSTEEKFDLMRFVDLINPGVRILFIIRPNGDDAFFFKRITGILDQTENGHASVYHVDAHLVGQVAPVKETH